jgi:hypothetical protein
MSLPLLNFLIIGYVISQVACVIVLVVYSRISLTTSKVVTLVHALIAIVLFIKLFQVKGNTTFSIAVLFATFICTGIIAFAFVIRKKFPLAIKIYFSIFILSFPLYLYSPSKVFTVMSLGMLSADNANEIPLTGKYFLVRQQGMIKKEGALSSYKVIKRMGMFNKTIARDFVFGFDPDSTRVLKLDENSEISLRGFFKHPLNKSQYILDSVDATKKTITSRDTILQIKNK